MVEMADRATLVPINYKLLSHSSKPGLQNPINFNLTSDHPA